MASDDYPSRPIMRTWRPEDMPKEEVVVGGPRWRRDAAGAQRVPFRRSRYFRTGVLGLLALVFIGLLVWVSSWLYPPRPACLVLIGAGYEDNLAVPANVYGRRSMDDLANLTRAGAKGSFILRAGLFRLHRDPLEFRRDSVWDNDIDAFAEKTIIIYFALNGGCDAQGPYLLPDNAGLGPEPNNRLRVKAILERLKGLPREKNKLLIFDATQCSAWWPLGMLHNDFVRGLTQLDEQIKEVPGLVVLSSTDVDQRSWGSDDWKRTIFAHYLTEGLAGAADVKKVGRIDTLDLHQYIRQNVERWTRINRQALQTPLLLPAGAEGQQRARGMYLTMTQGDYQPPDPTQLPTFTAPPELLQAWNDYRRLSEQVPAPAVYSPHLWRQYQATLLRYEQLLLAGDTATAGAMAGQLRSLERQIQQAQRLELTSIYNTLAMPAAAGNIGSDPPRVLAMVNDLWDAPLADQRKLWAKQQQSVVEPVYRRILPARMADQIIDRAAENPGQNLDRAYQVLQIVCDPLRPRPAEVHFLTMLRRDLPKPLTLDQSGIVSQALRVRRLAESAALGTVGRAQPYSEQIVLWNTPAVAAADWERRQGEDLIFTSDKDHWKEGSVHLDAADRRYRDIQTQNTSVRTALATRDQLLNGLVYYAQWLAQRRQAATASPQQLDAQLVAEVEDLWSQTQTLTFQLEKNPTTAGQADETDYPALQQQAEALDKRLHALETRWTESWRESMAIDTPATWRDCFDALVVPVTDPQLRLRLVGNYRRISRELLIRTGQNETNAQAISVSANRQSVLDQSRKQGRMALAVLGQRTFDEMLGGGRENFQEVSHRIETFAVEEQWWTSLLRAGDQIGYRFVHMPSEIAQQVALSQKTADRKQVWPGLRRADRLARVVPGPLTPAIQDNAADLYRRWLFQNLLLDQAGRTLDDHWFAEEENADRPYFRAAGLLYLDDARKLIARQPPQPPIDALTQKLNLPGDLVLSSPPRIVATSEQSFHVDYQVRPGPDAYVPPGLPVFWAESDQLLKTTDPPPDERLVRKLTTDKPVEPIRTVLTSPLLIQAETNPPPVPRRQRATLRMRGLFRGQRIERQTPVDLFPTPEITVALPPTPTTADLVVRAPKELHDRYGDGNGSIVIVMDCSGSMGEPPGTPYTPKTKFNEMTNALKIVLQKLPKGTTVSLWIFGQAIPPNNTAQRAEDTIRRLQDPIRWDPQDANQLAALMKKVQYPALVPWNESPIVRTMLVAKNDLKNAPGFKTMLVLTDGMDNCFKDDKQYNPKGLDIPTVLREQFGDAGIAVNIIGFKVVNKEEATARAQFKVVEDLPLPGRFLTVNDAGELAIQLERAMRQRLRYWLDREDNSLAPGTPNDGLDVSIIGHNDQWYPQLLTPSGYKVRTYTSERIQKSIILDPGDLLLVDLDDVAKGKGQELRRGVFSRADYPSKPFKEANNWRLAVLQNQRVGDDGLQMLTTLERVPTQTEVILQVVKPRDFWFELRPRQETPTAFAQRWVYHSGYPAPAWGLDVPAWPLLPDVGTPAIPTIRAWWNPDQEWPPSAIVERGPTLPSVLGLTERTVPVGDDSVVIENIQIEKHVVQVRPGVRESRSCLVVRLRYNPRQPVRARPRGLSPEGQEHRWYTEAGCYSGLYWPVTEAQAKDKLAGVGIISLTSFQRDAELRGYFIEMDKLAAPQANDVRPQPPVELK